MNNAKLLDTVRFINSYGIEHDQVLWPAHCVRDSSGAAFSPDLDLPEGFVRIPKGRLLDVETYSAFGDPDGLENTMLHEKLQKLSVNTMVFCGIAYDYCVGMSALDAAKLGYRVIFVEDACVCISKEERASMRQRLLDHGILLTTADQLPSVLTDERIPLQHILHHIRSVQEKATDLC